jgi:hypothetical protein
VDVSLTKPKTIYTRLDQREQAVALLAAAVELAASGGTLVTIDDEETARVAGEYRAQAQKLIKDLDAERLEMTAGARATVEAINGKFNEQIDALKAKERAISKAISNYMDRRDAEQRRQREEAARAAREEQQQREAIAAERGEEAPPPPPPKPVVQTDPFKLHGSHGSTTSQRDNWKYRLVDITKVPEHLLVLPEDRIAKAIANAAVKQAIKARLSQATDLPAASRQTYTDVIPGLEIYNEPHLASRTV